MYWMPTLTLVRKPASVIVPPGIRMSSSCSAVTLTSGRWRSSWFGRFPSAPSNSLIAVSTRSGCATQVPSNPSVASRFLSSRTFASAVSVTAGSRRLGMTFHLRQVEIRSAPSLEQAPRVMEDVQAEVEDRAGDRSAIDRQMPLDEMPSARSYDERRDLVVELVLATVGILERDPAFD